MLRDVPGSSCVYFPSQPENRPFSPRNLVPIDWRMALETKQRALDVLVTVVVLLLLGLSADGAREYMSVYRPLYVHVSVSTSVRYPLCIKLRVSPYMCLQL